LGNNFELLVHGPIAERHGATDPDAPTLRCRDLVSDPLADDLPLELAKERRTFSVSLPMLDVVLKDWVTETNETSFSSKSSTSFAKSARDRVRRSTL
jgi:hypothetical protein